MHGCLFGRGIFSTILDDFVSLAWMLCMSRLVTVVIGHRSDFVKEGSKMAL